MQTKIEARGGIMKEQPSFLLNGLANPCYAKKFAVTREIEDGSRILFEHKTWSILVFVKKSIESRSNINPFLLVNIEEACKCDVPYPFNDVYLWGVDISVKRNKGKVLIIPFLEVGQGIFLSRKTFDKEDRISGLFYEISSMFILDSSLRC